MSNYFYEEDTYQEDGWSDYTTEQIDMLLAKYDIDLSQEDEESEEYSPMLERHRK